MWCIGKLTQDYRKRMHELLKLYAKPYHLKEPVVCVDEKSKQLLGDLRPGLPLKPGVALRSDYEYVRRGTCNLFVAVDPKGGQRTVQVTEHRTQVDFVNFIRYLLQTVYAKARRIHVVLDNLNTHFRRGFEKVLGLAAANALLRRVLFHYTPKHASWLNMAEIEIGILDRQCLNQRWPDRHTLIREVNAWQQHRNTQKRGIAWTFSRQDADLKMKKYYVP